MILSEAIDAVAKMISGYANKGQADRSYIGTMAALLCQYPRSVALECAHPFTGVAITTKFMPTPADVVAWCEPKTARLHRIVERQDQVREQLEERARFEQQDREKPLEERQQMIDKFRRDLAQGGIFIMESEKERAERIIDASAAKFKRYSNEELRELYPPKKTEAAE